MNKSSVFFSWFTYMLSKGRINLEQILTLLLHCAQTHSLKTHLRQLLATRCSFSENCIFWPLGWICCDVSIHVKIGSCLECSFSLRSLLVSFLIGTGLTHTWTLQTSKLPKDLLVWRCKHLLFINESSTLCLRVLVWLCCFFPSSQFLWIQ